MAATRTTAVQATAKRAGAARGLVAAAMVVALGLAAACAGGSDTTARGSGSTASNATASSTTSKRGSEGNEVVLLTYDAFALPDKAAAEFERRTGAKVKVVANGDTGAMLSGALLSAGSPDADVIFGIDNTIATQATSQPLLEDYTPKGASSVPAEVKLPGKLGGRLTPIDTGDVCINIDSAWFTQHGVAPPETLADLTDPRYKDLLVVESPVTSSPGVAFLLATVEASGEQGFADYWQKLKDNGVRVAPSWDQAYQQDYTVSGGDRPLVVSYASSPPAEVVYSEGKRTEPASSVMTASCVSQVEYAGVLAGAEHPVLARELVAFMLDTPWQAALPLSNFVYPVTDVPLPPEFRKWAPRPADPIRVDAEAVGRNRDKWIEQWRSVME